MVVFVCFRWSFRTLGQWIRAQAATELVAVNFHVAARTRPGGRLTFLWLSPKKPKEKKGDPQSGPLRGPLKRLKEPENLETSLLRSRRTSRLFNPSPPAFSSPTRTGGRNEFGFGDALTPALSRRERE